MTVYTADSYISPVELYFSYMYKRHYPVAVCAESRRRVRHKFFDLFLERNDEQMAKKQSQLLKRLIAISLAAMITVGGLPAATGGGFGFDTGITANAVDYTFVTTSEELQAAFQTSGTCIL